MALSFLEPPALSCCLSPASLGTRRITNRRVFNLLYNCENECRIFLKKPPSPLYSIAYPHKLLSAISKAFFTYSGKNSLLRSFKSSTSALDTSLQAHHHALPLLSPAPLFAPPTCSGFMACTVV